MSRGGLEALYQCVTVVQRSIIHQLPPSDFLSSEPQECFIQWAYQMQSLRSTFWEKLDGKTGHDWHFSENNSIFASGYSEVQRKSEHWASRSDFLDDDKCEGKKSWQSFRSVCLLFSDSPRQDVSRSSHSTHRKTLRFLFAGNSYSLQQNPCAHYWKVFPVWFTSSYKPQSKEGVWDVTTTSKWALHETPGL